ncbi:MAG TPA: hypothetical protein VM537_21650, partial [Anaerolineae bacterium]|nr:hypothetical protein [Anaerolineae bacterium]
DWFGVAVRLKVVNRDLLAALEAVEWRYLDDQEEACCPCCYGRVRDERHLPTCQLAAALAKAKEEG